MSTRKEPEVNLELVKEHGLSEDEYNKIKEILGRKPTFTELGIFSVMWSEHCSYKNSLSMLKTLPREGKNLLVEAGEENAGLVDIGNGMAISFKIESHNHPSAVEPFQGATTGVGGILRDVFTMGARPIANLNSLRFGPLNKARNRYLFEHVVDGIGHYGNCMGIPTVGGEVYFDKGYSENPLVNAMAIGIVKHDETKSAIAKGEGNTVIIIGSATGRDGIHGATFASDELDEDSEQDRPSVQVGDPFQEKKLLEATLELCKKDFVVGIQDMGAAGFTSSSSEMAEKGGVGMKIDLDKVPRREPGMTPYEIMLSESQERMLLVVKKGFEPEAKKILDKWDLEFAEVGEVISSGNLEIFENGELVADIPADALAGELEYQRETKKPEYLKETENLDLESIPEPEDFNEVLIKLVSSPNIADKSWVYKQYDHSVRSNTMVKPGSSAAVVRIKGTNKALATCTDGNGRYVYLNPYEGGKIAVAESARNVVCSGAKPIAITNCLNFGNPYDPEVYYQFKHAVLGIGDACRKLNTPVTGGNVSFYNQAEQSRIFPTPVIGMVGIMNKLDDATTAWFKKPGNFIMMFGAVKGELGGSEYLKIIHDKVAGNSPELNLDFEKRIQKACLAGIRGRIINSAIDISDGGFATAVAEACILNKDSNIGAEIHFSEKIRNDELLFSETQSVIIITIDEDKLLEIEKISSRYSVPCTTVGKVTDGGRLKINNEIDIEVDKLRKAYTEAIPKIMEAGSTE